MVHYLLLDPEARREQLLRKFLLGWKLLATALERGARRSGIWRSLRRRLKGMSSRRTGGRAWCCRDKAFAKEDFPVRTLAPGEVLALRGDFFVRRQQMEAARPLLEKGVALGPDIAATHEALGFYYFRNVDFAAADRR